MYHLSHSINQLYKDYLSKATKTNISLDLDFSDPTLQVQHPSEIKQIIQSYLDFAIKSRPVSPKKSTIIVQIMPTKIIIKDSFYQFNQVKTKEFLAKITESSDRKITFSSRIGFGSSFSIPLE